MPTYQSEFEMVNVMLNRHTWVLVADGEKALFLRNKHDMNNVQLGIIHQMHHSNPATREQGSDRPGRHPSGPGLGRSAVDDTDWHEISKKRFAKEIADELYCHAHKGEFERLIIVAPPLMLGEMRQEFHKEVSDKIVSEIPKTLTNHSTNDIQTIVEES
jgi:protein required for attachment to host cells